MQHLTPVGLSKDGKQLVLISNSGEEFAVPVDHRFRAAIRGDQARSGPLEMKMESALRPRDIQSRIRAGESAEAVAAAAQTTVESIMAFAAPVLAQTAQKSSIRRTTSEANPTARTLEEASRQHLATVAVRADDVEWDAWRREDGRWSLVAEYIAGDDVHRAEFSYDQPGRYVLAENDEARLLTGETVLTAEPQEPVRRLSAVPNDDGDELPLGDDAIELVRDNPRPATDQDRDFDSEESNVSTSDLTEAVTAVRAAPEELLFSDYSIDDNSIDAVASDDADADWIAPAMNTPTYAATAPVEEPELGFEATTDQTHVEEPTADEPTAEVPVAPASEQPKKKGRSSVPSWDEIMFGGGKHE
jgi:hypothetical protein